MNNEMTVSEKSELKLEDRKNLSITGVIEVLNFDDEKIYLNTSLGALQILGDCLKINKIDVKNGDVTISGKVKSMVYKTQQKKKRRRVKFFRKGLKRE